MFILLNWVKYYTKEMAKALKIVILGMMVILTVIIIKYQPAYAVTLAGEELGYVKNKERFELKIKNDLEDTTGNIAFKEQLAVPEYTLKLISRNKPCQEKEVQMAINDSTMTTYKVYAVTVDGNVQTRIATEEQAKNVIDEMKSGVDAAVELNVGLIEQYTTEFSVQSQEEASGILNTIKVAKVSEYEAAKAAQKKATKKVMISNKTSTSVGTIAGISLVRPISGTITSRYGSRSARRSSSHTGLDIATSSGTPITPIAAGTVTFAARKGSYGNLVIVNHGNGIESYYAHCSEIYATQGQAVNVNTIISAVGSTGNSTGPHLHLEIRQNGTPLNPENYLY